METWINVDTCKLITATKVARFATGLYSKVDNVANFSIPSVILKLRLCAPLCAADFASFLSVL